MDRQTDRVLHPHPVKVLKLHADILRTEDGRDDSAALILFFTLKIPYKEIIFVVQWQEQTKQVILEAKFSYKWSLSWLARQ